MATLEIGTAIFRGNRAIHPEFIRNSFRIHRRVLYFLTQPTVSNGLNPSTRRYGGCTGLRGPPTQEVAIEGTATVPIHGGFEN